MRKTDTEKITVAKIWKTFMFYLITLQELQAKQKI